MNQLASTLGFKVILQQNQARFIPVCDHNSVSQGLGCAPPVILTTNISAALVPGEGNPAFFRTLLSPPSQAWILLQQPTYSPVDVPFGKPLLLSYKNLGFFYVQAHSLKSSLGRRPPDRLCSAVHNLKKKPAPIWPFGLVVFSSCLESIIGSEDQTQLFKVLM